MSFLINPFIYAVGPVGCSGSLISTTSNLAYYNFQGSMTDYSGQGNYATPTNLSYTSSGWYQSGGTFNGSSTNVNMPSKDYSIATGYTITAWIKTNTSRVTPMQILCKDKVNAGAANRRDFQFRVDGTADGVGKLRFVRFSNNTTVVSNFASTGTVNSGNWVHVAAVFNNGVGSKIYINGVEDGSDSVTTNNQNSTDSNIRIGSLEDNASSGIANVFSGNTDEVSFWNRPLSASEILTLASSTCPLIAASPAFTNTYSMQMIRTTTTANIERLYINNQSNAIDTAIRDTTPNISVSFWFKPSTASTSTARSMFSKYDNYAGIDRCLDIFLRGEDNRLHIYGQYDANNSSMNLVTEAIFTASTWNHFLLVYDNTQTTAGTIAKVYLNGVEYTNWWYQSVSTTNKRFNNQTTQADRAFVTTGCFYSGPAVRTPSSGYGGLIDDLTFWDKSLSSIEVGELYNSGLPKDVSQMSSYSSNCLAWYRMGDAIGDVWNGSTWTISNVKGTASTDLLSVNLVEADRVTTIY